MLSSLNAYRTLLKQSFCIQRIILPKIMVSIMKRLSIFLTSLLLSSQCLAVSGSEAMASAKSNNNDHTTSAFNQFNVNSATPPQSGGSSIVVANGHSGGKCTTVRPPAGTSVSTHNIYVVGTYEDQTNHEASHTRGVAQQIYSNGGAYICAAWLHARGYSFYYQVTAYPK